MRLPFLSARLQYVDFYPVHLPELQRLRAQIENVSDTADPIADACRAATVNGAYPAAGPLAMTSALGRHTGVMLVSRRPF